jgi:hypothetical protein
MFSLAGGSCTFLSATRKGYQALARQLRDELAALPGVTAWMDESIEAGEVGASIERD